MPGIRYCLFAVLTLLAAPEISLGQSSSNQTKQVLEQSQPNVAAPPILRTTTRLVQLNVIVQDKKGNAVRGLPKKDFLLLDNGNPQNIALFSEESPKIATGAIEPSSEPPSYVFGNRVHHQTDLASSVTVILFDALNTSFKDQSYAKTQILAFLQQIQPQDHVAIYLLTKQLTVINEFTQDSKSLLQAIERFKADPSLLLKAGNPQYMVAADMGVQDFKAAQHLATLMNQASSTGSDIANLDRVQITAQAITAIANHVANIPGRKNLIWVSGGFPISISFDTSPNSPVDVASQNFAPVLTRLARTLNQANLAIYPVDARGLFVPGETDTSLAHPFGPYSQPTDIGAGQDEQSAMDVLAVRTGGRAFYNTNDIKGAIQRTIADSAASYVLGYYPDHGNWDGHFHELKLKTKTAGLVLRYRNGYYALPTSPDSTELARSVLQDALWSPVDATSLEIQVKIERIHTESRNLDLRVKLDAAELLFKDSGTSHTGNVDAIYLQLGPGDAVVTADPLSYNLRLNDEQYKAVMSHGYVLKETLSIRPTTRSLRIVVRDAGSGAVGSVTIPLTQFFPLQESPN